MTANQIAIFSVVMAVLVVMFILFNYDRIRNLARITKMELPPAPPEGIEFFTDEDWLFAEAAQLTELLKWKPIEAEKDGDCWFATREGMCYECGTVVLVREQAFPSSGGGFYMHYDCAVDALAGLPPRRAGKAVVPRRMKPPPPPRPRRTVEQIESTPPDDGDSEPPRGKRPPPDTAWIKSAPIGRRHHRPPRGGSGQSKRAR